MIIDPPISEISKRVDSRYTLVTMAAKRARMIGQNTDAALVQCDDKNPVSVAVREIAAGIVGYVRPTVETPAIDYWPQGHKDEDVIDDMDADKDADDGEEAESAE